jgi:hypothetical protein
MFQCAQQQATILSCFFEHNTRAITCGWMLLTKGDSRERSPPAGKERAISNPWVHTHCRMHTHIQSKWSCGLFASACEPASISMAWFRRNFQGWCRYSREWWIKSVVVRQNILLHRIIAWTKVGVCQFCVFK